MSLTCKATTHVSEHLRRARAAFWWERANHLEELPKSEKHIRLSTRRTIWRWAQHTY